MSTFSDIWEIITKYPIVTTITIGILALILNWQRNSISKKGLNISKASVESQKAKFELYLYESYRLNLIFFDKIKVILFNINIKNKSQSTNSFIVYLEVTYFDKNESKLSLILDHEPNLINQFKKKNYSILPQNINLNGNNSIDGWVLFKQPQELSNQRIDTYKVCLKDLNGNVVDITSAIIKDTDYEI